MKDDLLLKDIGDRIRSRRKEINMTQEKLAEIMDVSIQMISNLEQGKKAIRPENIVKLCNALGVSADFILRGVTSEQDIEEISNLINSLSYDDQQLIKQLAIKLSGQK